MSEQRFRDYLAQIRGEVPAAELDRRVQRELGPDHKLPERFTSQTEHGRLRAPDEDVARAVGRALGIPGDDVWRVAARDRMHQSGVLAFHDAEVARMRDDAQRQGSDLEDEERELIAAVRRVSRSETASQLASLLQSVAALDAEGWRGRDHETPGGIRRGASAGATLSRAMAYLQWMQSQGELSWIGTVVQQLETAARATSLEILPVEDAFADALGLSPSERQGLTMAEAVRRAASGSQNEDSAD